MCVCVCVHLCFCTFFFKIFSRPLEPPCYFFLLKALASFNCKCALNFLERYLLCLSFFFPLFYYCLHRKPCANGFVKWYGAGVGVEMAVMLLQKVHHTAVILFRYLLFALLVAILFFSPSYMAKTHTHTHERKIGTFFSLPLALLSRARGSSSLTFALFVFSQASWHSSRCTLRMRFALFFFSPSFASVPLWCSPFLLLLNFLTSPKFVLCFGAVALRSFPAIPRRKIRETNASSTVSVLRPIKSED